MNQQPDITIVSVVKNDKEGLLNTISSVATQSYTSFEYIVIDGNSTDGTVESAQQHENINIFISEPDMGVYHAMNKAIKVARGTWLLFMNAGDCFAHPDSLLNAVKQISQDTDVIYSDWMYRETNKKIIADIKKLNVRHQSVIYKKELHEIYGNYVVGKKVSISDYIFFLSIRHLNWKYSSTHISICNQDGLSAQPSHLYQRILSECIYGKRSRLSTAIILILYPIYRFFKHSVFHKS